MTSIDQIPDLLDELEAIYDSSVANLRTALNAYARDSVRPDRKARDVGAFAYPELRIDYAPEGTPPENQPAETGDLISNATERRRGADSGC